jgi:predicted RNA binding protein YcfA (HicA-like mRNA interferase family)
VPPIAPISHRDFIYYLRQCGFEGPYPGGNHMVMYKENFKLTIPNPHRGGISKAFLLRLLKQAGLTREEWEQL